MKSHLTGEPPLLSRPRDVNFLLYEWRDVESLGGHVVLAWIWLEQALAAEGKTGDFYDGKRAAARHFFTCELPKTAAQFDLLASLDRLGYENGGPDVLGYENGGPDVLGYEDVRDPECRGGCVLIDVEAISIEGGDLLTRAGATAPSIGVPGAAGRSSWSSFLCGGERCAG